MFSSESATDVTKPRTSSYYIQIINDILYLTSDLGPSIDD
jgi:hypothetical protein